MRRPKGTRRHVAAWAALLALVWHALIPLGQALPSPWAVDPVSGESLPLVICTAHGLTTIPAPDLPDHSPVPVGGMECPICQMQAPGGLPPPPMHLARPVLFSPLPPALPPEAAPAGRDIPTPLPRGPPALA